MEKKNGWDEKEKRSISGMEKKRNVDGWKGWWVHARREQAIRVDRVWRRTVRRVEQQVHLQVRRVLSRCWSEWVGGVRAFVRWFHAPLSAPLPHPLPAHPSQRPLTPTDGEQFRFTDKRYSSNPFNPSNHPTDSTHPSHTLSVQVQDGC